MSSRVRSRLLSPLLLGAVVGIGLGAAGCGDQDGPAGTSPDVSTSSDPTPPPALPTLTPPTAPPGSPSDGFAKVRLTGVVSVEGAEVVLTDANGIAWRLQGRVAAGADLETGTRVTVTGTAVKGSDPGPGEAVPLEVTRLDVAD